MSDYNGEMVSAIGEIARLRAANDRLCKQVTQLERAVVALVIMAGGDVLIPDNLLVTADERGLVSMRKIDGIRLVDRSRAHP